MYALFIQATLIRVKRSFRQFNFIAYQISLDGLFVSLEAVVFFIFWHLIFALSLKPDFVQEQRPLKPSSFIMDKELTMA